MRIAVSVQPRPLITVQIRGHPETGRVDERKPRENFTSVFAIYSSCGSSASSHDPLLPQQSDRQRQPPVFVQTDMLKKGAAAADWSMPFCTVPGRSHAI